MKNFFKVFIVTAGLVLCFNVKSFAATDLAVWGGYAFAGNVKFYDLNEDFTATQFGFKCHYYLDLFQSVRFGLGPFCQYAIMKSEETGGFNPLRNSIGLDANFLFPRSSTPGFLPYVRITYSFYDKLKYDGATKSVSGFGIGIGGGAEFAITKTLRLFWEFMYDTPHCKKSENVDVVNAAFNMGIKFL